jgi:hypothetical protein
VFALADSADANPLQNRKCQHQFGDQGYCPFASNTERNNKDQNLATSHPDRVHDDRYPSIDDPNLGPAGIEPQNDGIHNQANPEDS